MIITFGNGHFNLNAISSSSSPSLCTLISMYIFDSTVINPCVPLSLMK